MKESEGEDVKCSSGAAAAAVHDFQLYLLPNFSAEDTRTRKLKKIRGNRKNSEIGKLPFEGISREKIGWRLTRKNAKLGAPT